MDTVNELGKELKKTKDRASRALKKASPEYGMAERARDIFDPIVPYTMNFRVPRKGMQIRANMQFEYPPPNGGSGGCCGDCYCAVCERFLVSEITSTSILLNRPYEPGSVSVFNGEVGISVGVSESDPDAGIIYLDACLGSDTVTVCYVYRYGDTNCTNYAEMAPFECVTDTFTRSVTGGWGTSDSGLVWNTSVTTDIVVNGTEGYLPVSGNRSCWLVPNVATGFTDMLISARLVNGAAGSFYFLGKSATYDTFEVDFSMGGSVVLWGPDETSTVNVGFSPDEQFFIRIIVTSATSFDAYIWRASETEPTTASLSLVDAGSNFAGLREVYVGGSGGTFDIYVTSLDIAGVNFCEPNCGITDSFTRTTTGGLGTSDYGTAWSRGPILYDGMDAYCDGTRAVLVESTETYSIMGGALRRAGSPTVTLYPLPVGTTRDIYFEMQWLNSPHVSTGPPDDWTEGVRCHFASSTDSGSSGTQYTTFWADHIEVYSSNSDNYLTTSFSPGTSKWCIRIFSETLEGLPTQVKVKYWAYGTAEPASYNIEWDAGYAYEGGPPYRYTPYDTIRFWTWGSLATVPQNMLYISNLDIANVNKCTT